MKWSFLPCARIFVGASLAGALIVSAAVGASDGEVCFSSGGSDMPVAAKLISVEPAGTLIFEGVEGTARLAGLTQLRPTGLEAVLRAGRTYLVHRVTEPDRYGRRGVQLVGDGTRWVQHELLSRGLALADGYEGIAADCRAALRAAERAGQAAKAGLWADAALITSADDLATLTGKQGHFVLVQGTVLSVGDRKRRVYLNFGQKWNEDFTVSLAKSGRGAFKGDLTRLLASKGKTLRVRGVLEWSGGPLIRVLDEGQIELALP